MRASLATRIRKLEGRYGPPLVVVLKSFTGQIGNVARIEGPGGPWHRTDDESSDALRARAVAAVLAASEPLAVLREVNAGGCDGRDWRR